MKMNKEQLTKTIKDYLLAGGLWNPELMDHKEVSILLLHALNYLTNNSDNKYNNE